MDKNHTILIVEDESNLGDSLKFFLEENGFKVFMALDGLEALEVFEAHKEEIEVVVSDLGLPRLGGWEAFLKMKEMKPEIKGILSSGYFNPLIKAGILKSGVDYFIQKPYNTSEIVTMIRGLLEK